MLFLPLLFATLALAAPVLKRDNATNIETDVAVISAAMLLPNSTQKNVVTYFYRASPFAL